MSENELEIRELKDIIESLDLKCKRLADLVAKLQLENQEKDDLAKQTTRTFEVIS